MPKILLPALLCLALTAGAQEVTLYDFTQGTHGWQAEHAVEDLRATPEGMAFRMTSEDPYVTSPPVANMPSGEKILLEIKIKSTGGSGGQIFYGPNFGAGNSANFSLEPDGEFHEYEVMIPGQPENTRLRIDPGNTAGGEATVQWIKATPLDPLLQTEFPAPAPVSLPDDAPSISAGSLTVRHHPSQWGGYIVQVDGAAVASGHANARIGYMSQGQPKYLEPQDVKVNAHEGKLEVQASIEDADGVTWKVSRVFEPAGENAINVTNTVRVSENRDVFHLPVLTLFPGLGSFGAEKTQGVLPGVEYLADEPSSSEADVRGEKANRRIVDDYKLTMPLMGITHQDRYIALSWKREKHPAPVFDSPDRVFNSGAHLMGLWYPAVGEARLEGELNVYRTMPLPKGEDYTLTATLLGGPGGNVVDIMKQYIARNPLPPVPEFEGGFDKAVKLLASGWLDSDLREGAEWRHAVWGDNFPPGPAADACAYMRWLAPYAGEELAGRLEQMAEAAFEQLPKPRTYQQTCSHVHPPAPPLLYGNWEVYLEARASAAHSILNDFDQQGLTHYHQQPDKPDYASTYWATHVNGLNAARLQPALEAAIMTGAQDVSQRALKILDQMIEHYHGTVPRGAQSWEMPLHTPDILASGRLVTCYVYGYLLSGEQKYLDEAQYWAWTGVPFVYMDHPVDGEIGPYATTAVLGATNWAAPYWIGQPVQWCGLVYRTALHQLAQVDERNAQQWEQLAKGITATGLQMTFDQEKQDLQGLLPDYFLLKPQTKDGPAISPGTVQGNLAELYGKTLLYDFVRVPESNVLVHAPGVIKQVTAQNGLQVEVEAWPKTPYWLHLVRIGGAPGSVQWNGQDVAQDSIHHNEKFQTLSVQVSGNGTLSVQ